MTKEQLQNDLDRFCGSEDFYEYKMLGRFRVFVYTDGIKYLCENAKAYWLLDAIASYQPKCKKDPMLKDMQFWTLKKHESGSGATLTCERDSGDVAIKQEIPYTDFPLDEVKVWLENGTLYLPNER